MAEIDKQVHKMYKTILKEGSYYLDPNRRKQNIYRLEVPQYNFEYDLRLGFPAVTTKELHWKSVVAETLWILKGETNIKWLVDNGVNIWNKDAYNYYVKTYNGLGIPMSNVEFIHHIKTHNDSLGDLGRVYGYQLRSFEGEFDQWKWLIKEMIDNPLSTKKDVTYINPLDKDKQALTPCHTGFSITVVKDSLKDGKYDFDLHFKMGSNDAFLGNPFNLASYGLIAEILAKETGHRPRKLLATLHNLHIYKPHIEKVKEQLKNSVTIYGKCKVEIEELSLGGIKLIDYKSFPKIKAQMFAYD